MPSQASDVDQFLDDLFNPVLDQLSDARSLAASIKGSSKSKSIEDCESLNSREFAKRIKGGGGRSIETSRASKFDESPSLDGEFDPLSLDISMFTRTVKGGGRGVASQQQVWIYDILYNVLTMDKNNVVGVLHPIPVRLTQKGSVSLTII